MFCFVVKLKWVSEVKEPRWGKVGQRRWGREDEGLGERYERKWNLEWSSDSTSVGKKISRAVKWCSSH